jgi:hypothetical protein
MEGRMDAIEQLKGLRDKARQEMESAMKAGQMNGVIKFARIIKEADDALQASRLAVERISAQLESDDDVSASTEVPRPQRPSSTADLPSRKARGKASRDEYLRRLLAKGINLSRLKGRTFQTSSGKRVGIAYASEVLANKWWMGLPDEQYDVVILLCETSSGETLDFVLPPNFVHRVWSRLTFSKEQRQREWHVVRSGPNYELDPKKRLGQITTYLSRLDPLR